MIEWNIETEGLPSGGHLDVGFISPSTAGSSFSSLDFQLFENGTSALNRSYTNLQSATTFLTNDLFDTGACSTSAGATLDVTRC